MRRNAPLQPLSAAVRPDSSATGIRCLLRLDLPGLREGRQRARQRHQRRGAADEVGDVQVQPVLADEVQDRLPRRAVARAAVSVSREVTFGEDVTGLEELHRVLRSHAERVGADLRRSNRRARTVTLKVRWPDFTTFTRSQTVTRPAQTTEELASAGRALLDEVFAKEGFELMPDDPRSFWMKFETVNREGWVGQRLDINTWEAEISFIQWTLLALNALSFLLIFVLMAVFGLAMTRILEKKLTTWREPAKL